jgi:hypothetical protein
MRLRAPTAAWYWALAAWPVFLAVALRTLYVFGPHQEIVGVAATILSWSIRLAFAASVVLILVFPLALKRTREGGSDNTVSMKVAFGMLCVVTVLQVLLTIVFFQPHY